MGGKWVVYQNIDMCFQGDKEIIGDWRKKTTIEELRKKVENKKYSAVCVGSFGHAALKKFDYQLTRGHMKPSQGYTNEIHVYFPNGDAPDDGAEKQIAAAEKELDVLKSRLPKDFKFHQGYGEATRKDQLGHVKSGGIENHCFKGDKMRWPLQWAAMIGDVAAIQLLASIGHDPNVKMTDWYDSEALGWAASFGQCKAIIALCDLGADPSRPANLAGFTPLTDAEREKQKGAIALLKEYQSGKRVIGKQPPKPEEASHTVVVGKAVNGKAAMPVVKGEDAKEAPTLYEMAEEFKTQLGITEEKHGGLLVNVVNAACQELGLPTEGKPLINRAEAAWRELHNAHASAYH